MLNEEERLAALKEQLAAIEHERWADWQRYLHSRCSQNPNGSLTIPAESVEHWERQIATPFTALSERKKGEDRKQVDRYWPLLLDAGLREEVWALRETNSNNIMCAEMQVKDLQKRVRELEADIAQCRDKYDGNHA